MKPAMATPHLIIIIIIINIVIINIILTIIIQTIIHTTTEARDGDTTPRLFASIIEMFIVLFLLSLSHCRTIVIIITALLA